MKASDHDGDPWVARWTAPDGAEHKLYEDDFDLLQQVGAGNVTVDSRYPRWVFVGARRHVTRDPVTRTFRRLVEIGVITGTRTRSVPAGAAPSSGGGGGGHDTTTYRLADQAAKAMLAAVR